MTDSDSNDSNSFPLKKQNLLRFDGNTARAKNFIGFVQIEKLQIEIYPKVFGKYDANDHTHFRLFLKHLFYWFSYCRKWKFPFSDLDLDVNDNWDIPELIINMIANTLYEVVSMNPFSTYEPEEASMSTPRGRINFNRYLQRGLSTGNQHILECDHEPFLFDNRLNRAIKYVARLLSNKTQFRETRDKLNELLFIFDEVEDCPCISSDLDMININRFFSSYDIVIDMCRLVLDQQLYNNTPYDKSHWCMLLPMEYVFEDFIAGFLERHFSNDWKVEYQKSELYLSSSPKAFAMQHDVLLTYKQSPGIRIIVDAKYKLRSRDYKLDKKKGVSQADLYQMTSYAYRRSCGQVLLLYPNIEESLNEPDTFEISSGFEPNQKIKVTAVEIPFWSIADFLQLKQKLTTQFEQILNSYKPTLS